MYVGHPRRARCTWDVRDVQNTSTYSMGEIKTNIEKKCIYLEQVRGPIYVHGPKKGKMYVGHPRRARCTWDTQGGQDVQNTSTYSTVTRPTYIKKKKNLQNIGYQKKANTTHCT